MAYQKKTTRASKSDEAFRAMKADLAAGADILRTDLQGDIHITVN